MKTPFVLAMLAALALPLSASAEPQGRCDGGDNIALGIITIATPAATFYVDDRNLPDGNGLWVYMESNGHDGLQRGGASPIVPDDSEICTDVGDWEPDTLLV